MKQFLIISFVLTVMLNSFTACSNGTMQESIDSASASPVEEVSIPESEEDNTPDPELPNSAVILSYQNGNVGITVPEQLKNRANQTEETPMGKYTHGEIEDIYIQFLFDDYIGGRITRYYDAPMTVAVGFLYNPNTEDFYLVGGINGIDVLSNNKIGFEIYRDAENPLLAKYSLVNQVTDKEYGYILLDQNLEISPVQLEIDLQKFTKEVSTIPGWNHAVRVLGAEYSETTNEYILIYSLWLNPEAGGGDVKYTQVYIAYYDQSGNFLSANPLDEARDYHYGSGPDILSLQWADGKLFVRCDPPPQNGAGAFLIDPVQHTSQVMLISPWSTISQEQMDTYPDYIDGDAWLDEHPEYRYTTDYDLGFALDGISLKDEEPPLKVIQGADGSIIVVDAATETNLCTLTKDHYLVGWQSGDDNSYIAVFGYFPSNGADEEILRLRILNNQNWDFRSAIEKDG